jgi:hypothetical protein
MSTGNKGPTGGKGESCACSGIDDEKEGREDDGRGKGVLTDRRIGDFATKRGYRGRESMAAPVERGKRDHDQPLHQDND